ncbi:uncharacterized protein LOC110857437 [Folsomia candida]|uniref:uncharacterized protein LOC110857437 n=1 Tax=Folsomia candida TaxID=158441 RepID=UPI000B900BC0|nr:uncharacterized protein LOC110857437 [Folsomia candida]XP_035713664.1 uncharacterized protein LOC110857437 [Folsomia candida]
MTLRLTSSRERTFPNFTSKKVPVDPSNAMSKVLRNSLILDAIFAKLDLPDLKNSRLVCHEWNDVGTAVLAKRTRLQVNELLSYKWPKFDKVAPVNDKLLRRLLISYKFDPSTPKKRKTDVIKKALTHVPKVSQLTREIKFFVAEKKFLPAFLEGIRALGSTKIQDIEILSGWRLDPDGDYKIAPRAFQKLPPQPSLTSLKFTINSEFRLDRTTGCHEFHPLIQILIDAAPNLTTLDVAASLYPNLEGCSSLKVLKYKFGTYYNYNIPDINLDNVIKMLAQVKDSVIVLELALDSLSTTLKQIQTVWDVPVMSNVTTLSTRSINTYQIRDFFDEDHFPKLKTLSIHQGTGTSHANLWGQHGEIQSLSVVVWSLRDKEFVGKLIRVFPAVKKLELRLEIAYHTSVSDINQTIEPFQIWDLERVNVHVATELQGVYPVLIQVLKAMSLMKGVKSVLFTGIFVKEDNFTPHVEDLILHSRGLTSVEMSGRMSTEIEERMRPIFEASGAPIHLRRSVPHN